MANRHRGGRCIARFVPGSFCGCDCPTVSVLRCVFTRISIFSLAGSRMNAVSSAPDLPSGRSVAVIVPPIRRMKIRHRCKPIPTPDANRCSGFGKSFENLFPLFRDTGTVVPHFHHKTSRLCDRCKCGFLLRRNAERWTNRLLMIFGQRLPVGDLHQAIRDLFRSNGCAAVAPWDQT